MEAAGFAARPVLGTGRFLRALGDDRLVARIRAGDQRAFEAVYDRHHRRLLAFCRHMLGTREEAEDVLQHTFAAAYRSICDSEQDIQLKAWLYAIARNRCVSILRVRREQVALDDVSSVTDGLHRQVQQRADLRELLDDLQSLPDDQRAALVLSELGAHSHDEIAMILEVRKEKVKALVFQARESLATSRRARETPCHEIQEQLATLRGAALRRAPIRRHVDNCAGCTAFKSEVQRQRAAMAVILPAAPSLALKSSVLGPLLGGSGIAAGLGAGAAVGHVASSAAGAGGGIAALGNGLAAKAIATAAVVASVGGGGIAADKLGKQAVPHSKEPATRTVVKSAPHSAVPSSRPAAPTTVPQSAGAPGTGAPSRPSGHDLQAVGRAKAVKQRKPRRRGPAVAPAVVAPALPVARGHERDDGRRYDRHEKRKRDGKRRGKGDNAAAVQQQHGRQQQALTAPAAQPQGGAGDDKVKAKSTQQAAAPAARQDAHQQAVAAPRATGDGSGVSAAPPPEQARTDDPAQSGTPESTSEATTAPEPPKAERGARGGGGGGGTTRGPGRPAGTRPGDD